MLLKVSRLHHARNSIDGKKIFDRIKFDIQKGDKIAFISRDPMAMTSFFEIINGEIKADSGTYEWGTTVTTAYLPNDNILYF